MNTTSLGKKYVLLFTVIIEYILSNILQEKRNISFFKEGNTLAVLCIQRVTFRVGLFFYRSTTFTRTIRSPLAHYPNTRDSQGGTQNPSSKGDLGLGIWVPDSKARSGVPSQWDSCHKSGPTASRKLVLLCSDSHCCMVVLFNSPK